MTILAFVGVRVILSVVWIVILTVLGVVVLVVDSVVDICKALVQPLILQVIILVRRVKFSHQIWVFY